MRKTLVLVLLLAAIPAWGQQRFDATLQAALNLCQVDGDDAGHYNHLGLRAGVSTSFTLTPDTRSPWRLEVGVAYSAKGSQMNHSDGVIALQYVELPILMTYNAMDGHLRIGAGVAPAVNVGTKVTFNGISSPNHEATYRPGDWIPFTVLLRYRFTDHLGIEGRWQTSLVSITSGTATGTYRLWRSNKGTFNRLLSIGLTYQF